THMLGRWLLGPVWAMALALMLIVHPWYEHCARANYWAIECEAIKLVALVGILRVWLLIFRRANKTMQLIPVGILLALTGGLSWLASKEPGCGLATNLLILLGLVVALVQIIAWRKGPEVEYPRVGPIVPSEGKRPPRVHVIVVIALLIVVPILSLAM